MQINEEYFNSEEFKELLNNYETSMKTGNQIFMDVDDLVDIADYYNQEGKADEAMEVIDYALQMYPNATLPNVFMARDALTNQDFDKAHEYLDRIEEHDDPDYHYLKAEIMIAEGHIEEADRYLRDYGLTVDADEHEDFVKDCANLYVDYGVNDKAYEWMMRSRGDNSNDFKELMARTLFGLGKFKDSERIFNELIDSNPYSIRYWKALAGVQLMAEDYSDAISSSEYAIAIDPTDSEGLLCKANALMHLQNYEEAAKYYKRYTELEAFDELGFFHLGVCHIYMGKYEKALDELLMAERIAAPSSNALLQIYQELAFCYSALKQPDRALDMIDRTENMTDDHDNFLVIKGHILLENGLLQEAEKIWKQALVDSGFSPSIMLRIIVSLYDNHYLKAAYTLMKKFSETIEEEGEFPTEGYSYMALCCHDLGYKEEFLEYLGIAVEKNPTQAKTILGQLFPPDTDVNDYYSYMYHQLNK